MRNKTIWLMGLLTLILAVSCAAATVTGKVFFDANGDGGYQPGEHPMAGVAVSDGRQVVVTSDAGAYRMECEPGSIVYVTLPKGYRAAKSFYGNVEGDCKLDFAMAEWLASRADSLRFAQIADIHVTANEDTVSTFTSDLAEINAVSPGVAFILATGDLVNNGATVKEFENYVRSIATSTLPVFNVPGNHDAKMPGSDGNYVRHLGPLNYSFNVGNCHIVVVNCLDFGDVQKAWMERDLAVAPAGSRRIVAMHYLPTQAQADYFAGLGIAAVLSGHWHGDRAREHRGLLDLNTPPLRFGGIDRTARSFRIVEVAKGNVRSELRNGGFKHHAVVVAPAGSCATRNGKVRIVVDAYDSRCKVKSVVCRIGKTSVPLKQVSSWSWMGEAPAAAGKNVQHVVADITDVTGAHWSARSTFQLKPGAKPSLKLIGAAPTGGFVALSSPKGIGDTVAIGAGDHGDMRDCGIRVFNKELTPKWSYRTDSAIKNNVAISKDKLFATSVAGWPYAFDRATGRPLWKTPLDRDRERWEISATTYSDGMVFVGGASYVGAFDAVSGDKIWSANLSKSDWWPSCYVIPVVSDGKLILMTRGGGRAYAARTGDPLWDSPGNFHGCAVANGMIYTIRDNVPTALDLLNGKPLWSGTDKVGDTASAPAISGDRMVVGTADGRVCAYSLKDGGLLWQFQTGRALSSLQPYRRDISDVNSSPAVCESVVYVGSSDGMLYALSIIDGRKICSYNLGSPVASTPLIDGQLYVAAYDGNLYAFELLKR